MQFKNKVAVVTGGGRDIGRAVAIQLAEQGAHVVINYLSSKESAESTLSAIKSFGGSAILVQADVSNNGGIKTLTNETKKAFGEKVDILVNVAGGLFARKKITEMDEQFFDKVMDTNFKSVFLTCQSIIPLMPAGGVIINLSSLAARDGGGPGATIYAASKGAVTTFTRGLAKELGPEGIRVNAVTPGLIATTFHDTFSTLEGRKNVCNNTSLRREGKAEEVADLVVYLASEKSSFISGANFDINGGLAFS